MHYWNHLTKRSHENIKKIARRRQIKSQVRESERQRLQELCDRLNLGKSVTLDGALEIEKSIKKMKNKMKVNVKGSVRGN